MAWRHELDASVEAVNANLFGSAGRTPAPPAAATFDSGGQVVVEGGSVGDRGGVVGVPMVSPAYPGGVVYGNPSVLYPGRALHAASAAEMGRTPSGESNQRRLTAPSRSHSQSSKSRSKSHGRRSHAKSSSSRRHRSGSGGSGRERRTSSGGSHARGDALVLVAPNASQYEAPRRRQYSVDEATRFEIDSRVSVVSGKVNQLARRTEATEDETEALRTTIVAGQERVSAEQRRVDALRTELFAVKEQLKELEDECGHRRKEASRLHDRAKDIDSNVSRAMRELESLDSTARELPDFDTVRELIDNAIHNVEKVAREAATGQVQTRAEELKIGWQRRLDGLDDAFEQQKAQVQEEVKEIQDANEVELERHAQTVSELQLRATEADAAVKAACARNERLEVQAKALRQQVEALESTSQERSREWEPEESGTFAERAATARGLLLRMEADESRRVEGWDQQMAEMRATIRRADEAKRAAERDHRALREQQDELELARRRATEELERERDSITRIRTKLDEDAEVAAAARKDAERLAEEARAQADAATADRRRAASLRKNAEAEWRAAEAAAAPDVGDVDASPRRRGGESSAARHAIHAVAGGTTSAEDEDEHPTASDPESQEAADVVIRRLRSQNDRLEATLLARDAASRDGGQSFVAELSALGESLSEARARASAAQSQAAAERQRRSEAEARCAALTAQLADAERSSHASITETATSASEKAAIAQASLAETKASLSDTQARLQQAERSADAARQAADDGARREEQAAHRAEQAEREVATLQRQLESARREWMTTNGELQNARSAAERHAAAARRAEAAAAAAATSAGGHDAGDFAVHGQLAEAQADLRDLQRNHAALETQYAAAEAAVSTLKEELARSRSDQAAAERRASNSEQDASRSKTRLEELVSRQSDWQSQCEGLRESLAAAIAQVEQERNSAAAAQESLQRAAHADIRRLDEGRKAVQERCDSLQQQLLSNQEALATRDRELRQQQTDGVSMQHDLDAITSEREALQAELEGLRLAAHQSSRQWLSSSTVLRERLATALATAEGEAVSNASLRSEVARLSAATSDAHEMQRDRVSALESSLEAVGQERRDLQRTASDAVEAQRGAEARAARAEERHEALSTHLSELEAENERNRHAISQLRSAVQAPWEGLADGGSDAPDGVVEEALSSSVWVEVRSLARELTALRRRLAKVEASKDGAQHAHASAQQELKDNLLAANTRVAQLAVDVSALQGKLAASQAAESSAQEAASASRAEAVSARAERDEVFRASTASNAHAKAELRHCESKLLETQRRADTLHEKLEDSKATAAATSAAQDARYEDVVAALRTAIQEKGDAQASAEHARGQVASYKRAVQAARRDWQQQLAEARHALATAVGIQAANASESAAADRRESEALARRLQAQSEQLEIVRLERDELNKKSATYVEAAEMQVNELRSEISTLHGKLAALEECANDKDRTFQAASAVAAAEKQALEWRVTHLEQQLSEASEELAQAHVSATDESDDATARVRQLHDENNRLADELRQSKQRHIQLDEAQKSIRDLTTLHTEKARVAAETKAQLDAERRSRAEADSRFLAARAGWDSKLRTIKGLLHHTLEQEL